MCGTLVFRLCFYFLGSVSLVLVTLPARWWEFWGSANCGNLLVFFPRGGEFGGMWKQNTAIAGISGVFCWEGDVACQLWHFEKLVAFEASVIPEEICGMWSLLIRQKLRALFFDDFIAIATPAFLNDRYRFRESKSGSIFEFCFSHIFR